MRHIRLVPVLLALAACATPEERCVQDATRDLRTLSALIAESEATLARGFAYETQLRSVNVGVSACTYGGRRSRVGVCADNQIVNQRVPVAVDLDAERRKLASLQLKRAELDRAARPAIAQCGVPMTIAG